MRGGYAFEWEGWGAKTKLLIEAHGIAYKIRMGRGYKYMGASLKLILQFFAVAKNNRNHRKSAFYLAKSYMYGFSLKIRLKIA